MPRTYANNSMNRSLGRVGMAHGTAVHSASSGASYSGSPSSSSASSSYSASPKTYVDNSLNRSLGRVGLEHGSAVQSRSSSSSSPSASSPASPKTYVDNSLNRSLGRVGLEYDSAVQSRSSSSSSPSSPASPKTYVDNSLNRSLGRVGLEHGSAVQSRSSSSSSPSPSSSASPKIYVDNSYNRKLGRVGLQYGLAPQSSPSSPSSPASPKTYADTPQNRRLGRVGREHGTAVLSRKKQQTSTPTRESQERNDAQIGLWDLRWSELERHIESMMNREKQIQDYLEKSATDQNWTAKSRISKSLKEKLAGEFIQFKHLQMGKEIGQGSFGVVHFATYDGDAVAVKKLKLQELTKKRMKQFEEEVSLFCKLSHPSILQFVGACVEKPNLAIVMELMDMSLYEAIHIKEVDFEEKTKLDMMVQMSSGLEYLHSEKIAHCDLKTQNIMLNNVPDQETSDSAQGVVAKISDFGLSLMKSDAETSVSRPEGLVSRVGSPRYAAPESLRGEMMSVEQLKQADVYSMGLVLYELIAEEIPFEDMNLTQLMEQKGKKGEMPLFSFEVNSVVKTILEDCWNWTAEKRPSAASLASRNEGTTYIYPPVEE